MDAGFAAGDEVSSHYDPMIAKLIVRAPDRTTAARRLCAALEDYEIAGPVTNIEFLKRVCSHPSFIDEQLETGFIDKHADDLFRSSPTPSEVLAQAAIATILDEAKTDALGTSRSTGGGYGFASSFQSRQLRLLSTSNAKRGETDESTIQVNQTGSDLFDIKTGDNVFQSIRSHWDRSSRTLTSFLQHTRLDSRVIFNDNMIEVFQRGKHYRLQAVAPGWTAKALGTPDPMHSVLAPMPCKILRVEIEAGQQVKKDQSLVVIESMKMETTIRSPKDGVVAKVIHKAGVRSRRLWLMFLGLTSILGDVQGRNCVDRV